MIDFDQASDRLLAEILLVSTDNAEWGDHSLFADLVIQIFDICDMLEVAEMIADKYPKVQNTRSMLDVLLEALTRNTSLPDVKELYTRLMEL